MRSPPHRVAHLLPCTQVAKPAGGHRLRAHPLVSPGKLQDGAAHVVRHQLEDRRRVGRLLGVLALICSETETLDLLAILPLLLWPRMDLGPRLLKLGGRTRLIIHRFACVGCLFRWTTNDEHTRERRRGSSSSPKTSPTDKRDRDIIIKMMTVGKTSLRWSRGVGEGGRLRARRREGAEGATKSIE